MALGEYTVRSEIEIGRSPEDVFAFVTDSRNDPQWCHLVPEVTRMGVDESGLPSYRFVQRFGPTHSEGSIQVVSMASPSEFRSIATVMGGVFDTSYHLERANGGTRFIHTNKVKWTGGMRLLHPVQRRMTQRIMDRQLRTLKTILEAK